MADNNSVPDAISIDGHATSYNYYCNQDGKGAPFGSRKTATGSDSLNQKADDNQFTGAVLYGAGGKLKKGDIVIADNRTTGKKALIVIDDIGAGDGRGALVDLTEGPLTKALGVDVTAYDSNGGVAGVDNAGNISFTRVASVPSDEKGYFDKQLLKNVILKVGDINTIKDEAGNNIGKLSELEGMVTFVKDKSGNQIDTNQVASNVTVEVTQAYASNTSSQETKARDRLTQGFEWDRSKTVEENESNQRQNMLAQLQGMPPEQQLMFMVLAVLFGMLGGQDIGQMFTNLGHDTSLSQGERSLARVGSTSARTGNNSGLQDAWSRTELGGAKLPPLPTAAFDEANYSVPVRNPMSGEVKQLQIVANGKLQNLSNSDTAAYMLYINDKAATTRAGMADAKAGMTFDIAHFTAGKYGGADQLNGLNETMVSAFAADRGIDLAKEYGMKPHVVQENPEVAGMLRQTAISGEKPHFSNYGMSIRAKEVDNNAKQYAPGMHLGMSNHFDGPEDASGKVSIARGTFGLINGNSLSAEAGQHIMSEVNSRGAIDVKKSGYLSISNPTGMQRSVQSPFILMEHGNAYNSKESAMLGSASGVNQQMQAIMGGVAKFHLANNHQLGQSTAVAQAKTELSGAPAVQTEPVVTEEAKVDLTNVPVTAEDAGLPPLTASVRNQIKARAGRESVGLNVAETTAKIQTADTTSSTFNAAEVAARIKAHYSRSDNDQIFKDAGVSVEEGRRIMAKTKLDKREGRADILEVPPETYNELTRSGVTGLSKNPDNQFTLMGVTNGFDADIVGKKFGVDMDKDQFAQVLVKLHQTMKPEEVKTFAHDVYASKYLLGQNYHKLPSPLVVPAADMAFNKGPSAANWVMHNAALSMFGKSATPNPGAEKGLPGFDDPSRVGNGKSQEVYNQWKATYDNGLNNEQVALIQAAYAKDPKGFLNKYKELRIEHNAMDAAFDDVLKEKGVTESIYGAGKKDRDAFKRGWNGRAVEVTTEALREVEHSNKKSAEVPAHVRDSLDFFLGLKPESEKGAIAANKIPKQSEVSREKTNFASVPENAIAANNLKDCRTPSAKQSAALTA